MAAKKKKSSSSKSSQQVVREQLPVIRMLGQLRGGPNVKRAAVRAAGKPFVHAVCSICRNLEAGTLKPKRRPNPREARIIRDLATGKQQKGGTIFGLIPLIASLASTIAGAVAASRR